MSLKKPRIIEETKDFIEVEVPEGKSEEYDLENYECCGNGQDNKGNFYEYYFTDKNYDYKNKCRKDMDRGKKQ